MKCLFCDIVCQKQSALKIWENDEFLAFLDIRPINPGHLLLIPKTHIEDIYQIPEPLYSALFAAAKAVAKTLKIATTATRIGLVIEGFGVPHVHLHLVPINKGNELNPEKAKAVPKSELDKIHKALKKYFI